MANECIPFYEGANRVTGNATAAVGGKTFLSVSGAFVAPYPGNIVGVATCAAGKKPFGAAAYDAAAGQMVGVIREGIVPIICGAPVTAGTEVEVDGSGHAIPLASGKPAGVATSTTTAAGADLAVCLYQ